MHVHQGSILIALVASFAILTLLAASAIRFSVDPVGWTPQQVVLTHAQVDSPRIVQVTRSVSHPLLVMRPHHSSVG